MIFKTNNLTISQLELLSLCDDLEKFILDLENTLFIQSCSSDMPVLLIPYVHLFMEAMAPYKKEVGRLKKRIEEVQ